MPDYSRPNSPDRMLRVLSNAIPTHDRDFEQVRESDPPCCASCTFRYLIEEGGDIVTVSTSVHRFALRLVTKERILLYSFFLSFSLINYVLT